MPDSIDGDVYIKNLASFIRANERQVCAVRSTASNEQLANTGRSGKEPSSILSLGGGKPARLALTPHHLFYLLHRFTDLGLPVGPMTVRLETVQPEGSPTSYVSFLHDSYHKHVAAADAKSLQSVSSMRSTMSGISAIFSMFASKEAAQATVDHDLKYIYSAFTKIPALRLAPDPRAKVISGFEEFPFDRAVPVVAFKNLLSLELADVDIRAFYGWDTVSERVKTLSVRRGQLDDPVELISDLVLDDMDRRRARTSTPVPIYATASNELDRDAGRVRERNRARAHTLTRRESLSRSPARVRSLSRPSGLRGRTNSVSSAYSAVSTPADFGASAALGPSNWQFLKHLCLADNGISSVSNESMVPLGNSLVSLDLSRNLLVSIPEALSSLSRLAALNFSYNLVSSLHSLTHHPLPAITTLNLRGNKISSLAGLDRILSLERLDLRDNGLMDPTELARLTGAPNLSEIWVLGNPFVKTHGSYRVTIFNLFRSTPGYSEDILLDGNPPGLFEERQLVDRAEELVPSPVSTRHDPPSKVDDGGSDILPILKTFSFLSRSPPTPTRARRSPSPRKQSSDEADDAQLAAEPHIVAPVAIRPPAIKVTNPTPRNKKKPGRRRIVDLDLPDSGDDQMSTKTGGSAISSTKSPTSFSPPMSPEHDWARQGDEYRKRIETLRNDFGSGWLSVLSEEM